MDLRDSKIIDLEIIKDKVSHYMNFDEDFQEIEIDFFGGEPLLAFPLIKEAVDWIASQKWKKRYQFMIGTNGTVFSHEIKEWLIKQKHHLQLSLSIDGAKRSHDLGRSNSYDLIIKHIDFFREYWPHQPAKMTIYADTIPYIYENVVHLEDLDILFTANIAFENMWENEEQKRFTISVFEDQLSQLVDYYISHPELYPVIPLLASIPEYLGLPGKTGEDEHGIKRYCGSGHAMTVVDIDAKEYPCHRFLPWVTGNPLPLPPDVNHQTSWEPVICADCKLLQACPTCAGFNWEINKNTGHRTTFHCEFFKAQVKAACRLESIRMIQQYKQINELSEPVKKQFKIRLDAIMHMMETGL